MFFLINWNIEAPSIIKFTALNNPPFFPSPHLWRDVTTRVQKERGLKNNVQLLGITIKTFPIKELV